MPDPDKDTQQGTETRVCTTCGREVEDGWTHTPWHCRYCGPLDEDETHVEFTKAEPDPR